MPMLRFWAGTDRMSWPSTITWPEEGVSNPARMRRAVVLPQPEGPSMARNSPAAMSIENPSRALTVPKTQLRSRRATEVPPPVVCGTRRSTSLDEPLWATKSSGRDNAVIENLASLAIA